MNQRSAGAPRIGPLKKNTTLYLLTGITVGFCLLLLVPASSGADAGETGRGSRVDAGPGPMAEPPPFGMGYIPPAMDLSHIHAPLAGDHLILPSRFDWREAGKVTGVKNQGSCGSCYAFAWIAALESRVLIEEDSTFDFSENNVKECEWYGSSCNGGNDWLVAHHLTTAGAVLEACDPYVPSDVACKSTCPFRKTLYGWGVISGPSIPPVDVLKSYIETYGPVYTSMYAGSYDAWHSEFASYNGTYTLYHPGAEVPNHAVLIVGWDDDLPHAGGQGAWIVKNSWGTGWGGTCDYGSQRGYFTIAYGSANIGSNSSVPLEWGNPGVSDTLLYCDEGGAGGKIIFPGTTAWGLSKYVPLRAIKVDRVEFWTLDATTDVDVYIYDDFAGGAPSNLLASSLDNSYDLAGYHSVILNDPLYVAPGEDVYAVVKVTNAVSTGVLTYDTGGPVSAGRSYYSTNGAVFYEYTRGDLGIRLRARKCLEAPPTEEAPVILEVRDVEGDGGGHVAVAWSRSLYDDEGGEPRVDYYRVWRKRHVTLPLLGSGGKPEPDGPYEYGLDGPAWEVVATVAATGSPSYEVNAPTECDMSGPDTCWTCFCVTAHTGLVGPHFDSRAACGYSVDNGEASPPPGGEGDDGDLENPAGSDDVVLGLPRPNPAGQGFLIVFEARVPADVLLSVYDATGRRVAVLFEGFLQAGRHAVRWDPGLGRSPRVPPGLYFVWLETGHGIQTAKVVLIS